MIKKNIRLMYIIAFLQGMVFYGSIATLYRQVNGVTIFQITLIESISLVLCLALEIPWGILADTIGYKKSIVFCSILYFISKIIFYQANNFAGFLLERVILSIVLAGLSGVDTSILYLSSSKENSQHVFGIYTTLSRAGLILASLIFTIFLSTNYRLSALLTIITYGVAMICSFFLVEVKNESDTQRSSKKDFKQIFTNVLRNKKILLLLISIALFNETHQTITVFLNQLQFIKVGMSTSFIAIIFIIVNIVGLLSVFSNRLTKILGYKCMSVLSFLICGICCLILAITNSIILSILSILFIRVAFSLFTPLQMDLQNQQVTSNNRATELSIFSIFMSCIGVSTNLIFGKLAEINLNYSFYAGSVFCIVGLIFILISIEGNQQSVLNE